MARMSPDEIAQKWANRLGQSTGEIAAGVARVTEAPGRKAAAKKAKWQQGLQDAAGKWERNVAAVSLDDWKTATLDKGVARVAAGAQAAIPKMAQFQAEIGPHIDAGLARINSMPDNTLEERIAKSTAFQRHMATFKRRG